MMPEPCSICLCSRARCSCSSWRRSNSSCCLDSEGVGAADEHPIKLTKISQAVRLIGPTLFVTSGLISFASSKTADFSLRSTRIESEYGYGSTFYFTLPDNYSLVQGNSPRPQRFKSIDS